ncbi:F0F1 ATP synthase subunit B family protein [Granulicella aggregans]|uniref:F0F1 ATP synthase subunit B family protein n=1 Tax=Granulicella aggregans TaxID=474949 RepID=UPI0021E0BEA6|nr:F0F1 ATP synthase subunit B [Granulicella aggregans]
MLIDWFTVIAQMVNFLILVWLLKHFLYKPILNAIDTREKGIASKLADAEAKVASAQKQQADFEAKNKSFDEQRDAMKAKAEADAKTEHDRIIDAAQKQADGLRASEAAALKDDQAHQAAAIRRMAQDQVFAITRKTLTDLASVTLEERIGEVFTRRLGEMNAKDKYEMGAALKSSPEASPLRSAFTLPDEQKTAIQNALNETFSAVIRVRYETDANAVSGIELTAPGQKLSWSISSYLDSFDQSVAAMVTQETKPEPAAAPAAEAK